MIFFGIILFLILVYWRPQDFMGMDFFFRPILLVMSVTAFLWVLSKLKLKNFNTTLIFLLDYAIIGYFLAIVVSTVNYHWMRYTLDIFVRYGKIVIFYVLISECLDTKKKLEIFIHILSVLTFLIAGVAVLQRYGIDLFGTGMVDGRIQGAGIYENPNYLAYSVAMIVPIQFYLFKKQSFIPWKIVHLFMLYTSYVCVFFTKSRGGLLCILGTTVFMFSQRRRPIVKYAVLAAGIAFLVIILAAGPRFNLLNKQDGSIQMRIEAWYGGLNMLKAHPIIGVGAGTFNEHHKGKTAHSSFVLAGAETGLFGLFMWVSIIFFSMRLLRGVYISKPLRHYAWALEASIVSYTICSFFATFPYRVTFFILCGLISALVRVDMMSQSAEPDKILMTKEKMMPNLKLSWFTTGSIASLMVGLIVVWHLVVKNRF